ncbi:MAG: PadR family transcriptional regulator [Candidatus Micrarchaeia archaeon]
MAEALFNKSFIGPMGKIRSVAIEFRVLKCIGEKEAYPYSLFKKLSNSEHGRFFKLEKSELYNTIASLEKKGYIKVSRHKVAKKYYAITPKGKRVLSNLKRIYSKTLSEIIRLLSD